MRPQLISALPTPFDDDLAVDHAAYSALLRDVAPHVDGVLVAGTTGEFPALDDDERLELFRAAAAALPEHRVVAHVGHASAHQAARLARAAAADGVRSFALLTPYYLPSDDEATVAFFEEVLDAIPGAELFAYVFAERTGSEVSPALLGRILRLPGVVGAKLSGSASDRLVEFASAAPPDAAVLSGDDSRIPALAADGADGVVSGVSAAFPVAYAGLVEAVGAGDGGEIAALGAITAELSAAVGATIPSLKLALAARTGAPWRSRMALPTVSAERADRIRALTRQHA